MAVIFCTYLLSNTFYAVLSKNHFCRKLHTFSGKIVLLKPCWGKKNCLFPCPSESLKFFVIVTLLHIPSTVLDEKLSAVFLLQSNTLITRSSSKLLLVVPYVCKSYLSGSISCKLSPQGNMIEACNLNLRGTSLNLTP